MASEEELTSDSVDITERKVPDFLLKDLKTKVLTYIAESKTFEAEIQHIPGQPAKLLFSLGDKPAKQEPVRVTVKDGNERSNTLLVKNIPSSVDEELLELFFESKKKQGGGPVDSVQLYRAYKCALIKFVAPAGVETVMKKVPIKLLDVTLDIQPYFPLLEDNDVFGSLNVTGFPKQLTDDILAMYFEKNIQSSYNSGGANTVENLEASVRRTSYENVDEIVKEAVFTEDEDVSWEVPDYMAVHKDQTMVRDTENWEARETVEQVPHDQAQAAKLASYTFITEEYIQIYVYKHSILNLNVDCIVNPTNENLQFGGGVSRAIANAAGIEFERQSDNYVNRHGRLRVGSCCTTTAGNLPYKCVIHTVGPRASDYKNQEYSRLRLDLRNTLKQTFIAAQSQQLTSIGTTSISSGTYGVPQNVCAEEYAAAVLEYSRECGEHTTLKSIHFVDVDDRMISEIVQRFRKSFTCVT